MSKSLRQLLCELATLAYENKGYLCERITRSPGYVNRDALKAKGYRYLGGGCTRHVYEIEHEGKAYAIKFAFHTSSRIHNRREASAWNQFRHTTRKLMAEVHGISTCGRVLAMELVPNTMEDRWLELNQWNLALQDQLEKCEAMTQTEAMNMMSDNAGFNVGVRSNGDIVWIDYATAW